MKKENILVIILVCLGIASIFVYKDFNQSRSSDFVSDNNSQGSDTKTAIDWKSFDQGLELARAQNKPIFLYFYADWCSFCTKLKKTTFKDKDVLSYLGDHFVSIKVDTDRDKQRAIDWRVNGLPTLWFLDSDAQKLNAIPGYIDEENFLLVLKYHFTKAYKDLTYQQFVKMQ